MARSGCPYGCSCCKGRYVITALTLAVVAVTLAEAVVIDRDEIIHELVVEGDFRTPVDFDWIPGDVERVLICEKRGIIHLVTDGQVQSKPFLDIQDQLVSVGARGLMSCLVDSKFEEHPYIYVSYVDSRAQTTRYHSPKTGILSRFRVSADYSEATDEVIILGSDTIITQGCRGDVAIGRKDIICNDYSEHNNGGLAMDPETGNIFAAFGDAASPTVFDELPIRALQLDFTAGKILCIKRSGMACENNPFSKNGDRESNRAKVWNWGVRNPFRISWDEVFKVPLIANVGLASWESIFLGSKGENFGWPCREGQQINLRATDYSECKDIEKGTLDASGVSLWDYDHDFGTSVTGVARLSSSEWPTALRNLIAVCDYTRSWIKLIEVTGSGIRGSPMDLLSEVQGPVQLKQGPDGWLYYLSIVAQKLYRVRYEVDTSRPEVVSVFPPEDAENVETSAAIDVRFSKRIRASTANSENIKITQRSNNVVTEATVEIKPATNTVAVKPVEGLLKNHRYEVTVAGVEDTQGRKLQGIFASEFTTGTGFSAYVSDLEFLKEENGGSFPVLRDEHQYQKAQDFTPPLSLRGRVHEKGLGVQAYSEVEVDVPGGCTRFQSDAGIDDFRRIFESGEMFFEVLKDGERVYRNEIFVTKTSPALHIDVDVSGAKTVTLIAEKKLFSSSNGALGTWGSAIFRCGGYDMISPTIESVYPTTRIRVDQSIVVKFGEPMDLISTIDATEVYEPIGLGGYDLGISVTFNEQQNEMTVTPLDSLKYDAQYLLRIKNTAMDLASNRLTSTYERNFLTKILKPDGLTIALEELQPQNVSPSSNFEVSDGVGSSGIQEFDNGIALIAWSAIEIDLPSECERITFTAGKEGTRSDGKILTLKAFAPTTIGGRPKLFFSEDFADDSVAVAADFALPNFTLLRFSALVDDGISHGNFVNVEVTCGEEKISVSDLTVGSQKGRKASLNERLSGKPLTLKVLGTGSSKISLTPRVDVDYLVPGTCGDITMNVSVEDGGENVLVSLRDGSGAVLCSTRKLDSGEDQKLACSLEGVKEFSIRTNGNGGLAELSNAEIECAEGSRAPVCVFEDMPNTFRIGDVLNYSAACFDYTGQSISLNRLRWRVLLIHCQPFCHEHVQEDRSGIRQGSYTPPDHGDYYFMVFQTLVQDGDEVLRFSREVKPETVEVTVTTKPSGMTVGVDSLQGPAPLTSLVLVGAKFTINAVPEENGNEFDFWDDNKSLGENRELSFNTAGKRTYNAVYK
ncbi:hypothetical protein NDN08_005582 [Rhodosorus marinus]|uniref:Glycosyl hydrolase family 98 putative carbohydrate-binding module domain-containing protein n=1 Tax=Rhodosorus marinus TaxID=101924 RepID=A0AAV8V417_9RHOD|nr:hypothetical protein NDN08_005582 [Rhodosorus marinus]